MALNGQLYDTLAQSKAAGAATMNYGIFINNVIMFVIVAFAVFLVVRWFNRLRKKPEKEAPVRDCPECLSSIPINARRCKFCGVEIAAARATGSA